METLGTALISFILLMVSLIIYDWVSGYLKPFEFLTHALIYSIIVGAIVAVSMFCLNIIL